MRKDYLAFFTSLFLSRLADQILLFIVPLVVFQTTNSASWSGLAFFAESLPRFLAFPVCGALCDRYSPMKILHISQLYRALLCVLATGLYLLFGGLAWLVVLSALCGVLTTQGIMAREVVMPHIFQHYSYTKTLSYSQIADQTGLVLGPVVAALLLDVSQWHWVVLATGGLFLLADLCMWLWHRLSDISWTMFEQKPGIWVQPVRIALRHIREQPELQKVISLAVGVNLIVGVTLATSAAMVLGQFSADKDDYAVLQAAGAGVTIAILFLLARMVLPLRVLGGVAYSMLLIGAFISAVSPNLAGYAVGFLLIVGFDKMFNVYMRTIRQRVIPTADFGKTVGVITLLNNLSQPAAGLLVALLATSMGTPWVIAILAVLAALIGGMVIRIGAKVGRRMPGEL
ncbi:MFS transporter [Pseudomonas putida]|uniref:MFS transporter n=1 Tax=Pseudomonas putida TaxID=303 RepID=A0A4D6X732_PSEPU|nr:MFS transporter [Pseudomonas putida]QCI11552.1 MFS transporter [Pseudomonas putida]